jgi:hypothetical protein
MTEQVRIDPKIAAHVEAALEAGFTVYALPDTTLRPVGFVAVCLDEDGPWAHIQQPTMALDPVELDVPVTPHKDWGSGVKVDHDGTPEDAVRALRQACTEDMVTVRFMTRHYINKHGVPKVKNAGRKCISWFGDRAVKLGERGTNWTVPQLAGRLEVGDRFDPELTDGRDFGVLTVTGRKYGGPDFDLVILTVKELDHPIEIRQRQFVTLVGAA